MSTSQLNAIELERIQSAISKLKSFSTIDEDDLDMECRRVPVNYMTVAHAYSLAQRQQAHAKAERERVAAQLDIEVRTLLQAEGNKVTEAMVKSKIASHIKYSEALMNEIDSDADASLLRNALVALSIKKDMLVTLAANRRNELHD